MVLCSIPKDIWIIIFLYTYDNIDEIYQFGEEQTNNILVDSNNRKIRKISIICVIYILLVIIAQIMLCIIFCLNINQEINNISNNNDNNIKFWQPHFLLVLYK